MHRPPRTGASARLGLLRLWGRVKSFWRSTVWPVGLGGNLERRRTLGAHVCAFVVITAALGSPGHAQTIERYTPKLPPSTATPLPDQTEKAPEADAQAIGPDLKTIVLLGPKEDVYANVSDGVVIGDVLRLKGQEGAVEKALSPFLGKPISLRLIGDIEGAITKMYRDADHPFLAQFTPEQDISSGTLQIRVVEFVLGEVKLRPEDDTRRAWLRDRLTVKRSDFIDAHSLTDDLTWINHYPFRQTQAYFSPGEAPGVTDLTLVETRGKPWQVYGGYANTGTRSTGADRYFIGGSAGGLFGEGSVLAVQLTGSNGAFFDHGRLLPDRPAPPYRSLAFNAVLPVKARAQLEIGLDQVTTTLANAPFDTRNLINEASIGYRFSIPYPRLRHGLADLRIAAEMKRLDTETAFGGVAVQAAALEVYQAVLAYHSGRDDGAALSELDISLHLSPGRVTRANGPEAAVAYSQGRLHSTTYGYIDVNYDVRRRLEGDKTLHVRLMAKLSDQALPLTEQSGLGGPSYVRGYGLEDGSFDSAIIVRTELGVPEKAEGRFGISPFAFVDLGYGRDNVLRRGQDLGSVGSGLDLRLGRNVRLNASCAYTFRPGPATRSGAFHIDASLGASF